MTPFRALVVLAFLSGCSGSAAIDPGRDDAGGGEAGPDGSVAQSDGGTRSSDGGVSSVDGGADAGPEPTSAAFFATAYEEDLPEFKTQSNGDLWASCWSNDDALYGAAGDGFGFDPTKVGQALPNPPDVIVNKIVGNANNLSGTILSRTDQVSRVWTAGAFNRKPTGMVCRNGNLYLAVQDLSTNFDEAPAATITTSTDKGRTWTFDRNTAFFTNKIFTTVFFADFGKDGEHKFDNYVYAYGLDGNWRQPHNAALAQFTPTGLFLARVPETSIASRSTWEFFSGFDAQGSPTWSKELAAKKQVLTDTRRTHRNPDGSGGNTVISQGSVTYFPVFKRFVYATWSEFTHEFYEAPAPWGPWKLFYSKDFGPANAWDANRRGGYATTVASKYLSADNTTFYVTSNSFGLAAPPDYDFNLRRVVIRPWKYTQPENPKSESNLAVTGENATPEVRALHFGLRAQLSDGVVGTQTDDSWTGEVVARDWWGYTFTHAYNFNEVSYVTGAGFPDGGWFKAGLKVEVRRYGVWQEVAGLEISPAYPYSAAVAGQKRYTFKFTPTWGDGIRIIGEPGGSLTFTSIAELGVYFR